MLSSSEALGPVTRWHPRRPERDEHRRRHRSRRCVFVATQGRRRSGEALVRSGRAVGAERGALQPPQRNRAKRGAPRFEHQQQQTDDECWREPVGVGLDGRRQRPAVEFWSLGQQAHARESRKAWKDTARWVGDRPYRADEGTDCDQRNNSESASHRPPCHAAQDDPDCQIIHPRIGDNQETSNATGRPDVPLRSPCLRMITVGVGPRLSHPRRVPR